MCINELTISLASQHSLHALLLPLSLKPCFQTNSPSAFMSSSSSWFVCSFVWGWDPLRLIKVACMSMGWGVVYWRMDNFSYQWLHLKEMTPFPSSHWLPWASEKGVKPHELFPHLWWNIGSPTPVQVFHRKPQLQWGPQHSVPIHWLLCLFCPSSMIASEACTW